jgi:fumarylpyruvate hydrolase
MSNERYLFAPESTVALPILGGDELYPVNRVFCVGRNYEAHAREMGTEVDREAPFYFMKGSYAVTPSGSSIPYPSGTHNLHHEIELVVALGREAFEVSVETALDCVYGYACGLDLTRRDLQQAAKEKARPWDLGKNFEHSAVITTVAPVATIGHPTTGLIELRVNDALRQSADLSQQIWSVPEIISHLSRFYHLGAGDLIYTGTPEGVGPVQPGDRLEGRIEGVGVLLVDIVSR